MIVLVRVRDGVLKKGMKIRMMGTGATHLVDVAGVFTPKRQDVAELGPGEVGFFTASIKAVADAQVGDTITEERNLAAEPLPGFKPSVPVVFCGLFPIDAADFEDLRDSMAKLRLNDGQAFTTSRKTRPRARFRVPLWFPRPAAPRNRAGTSQP